MSESFVKNNKTKLEGLGLGKPALIKKWLEDYDIFKYTINDDLTIDVNEHVVIIGENIEKIPDYIQFNNVTGNFKIKFSHLKSLRGFPIRVTGICSCSGNKLESLEYCPKYIGDDFYCDSNLITNLKFIPEHIGNTLYISQNPIPLNDIVLTMKNNYKIYSSNYNETS